jgi:hypothetical protein
MLDRRKFLAVFSGIGLGSTLLPGKLWALAQGKPAITSEMIKDAEAIAGVALPEDLRAMMLDNLNDQAKGYQDIYALHLPNDVEPCLLFTVARTLLQDRARTWPRDDGAIVPGMPAGP